MPDYAIVTHRGGFSLQYIAADGRRLRRSLKTSDRGVAEHHAQKLWAALHKPLGDKVPDIWQAYVKDKLIDQVVIDPFGSTWKALEPSFGHMLAPSITREHCRAHAAKRGQAGRSNSTIHRELALLGAALKHHYGPKAPKIWTPPQAKPRDHYLTKEDVAKVMEVVDTPHTKLFIILAICTGARMSALLDLKWSQVNMDKGFIDLNPAGRDITNKRRSIVPINDRAREALEYAKVHALTDHVIEYNGRPVLSVKKSVAAASKAAGVPFSPHVLRHSSAVWMAEAGVPMTQIAQYLGHTSTRVTEQTYARYSPNFLKGAADALNF